MKQENQINLGILQVDRRTQSIKKLAKHAQIRTGWISYMRNAFGMRLKDLAVRAGVATPTAAQAERRESDGKVTLETLRKMANAMECDLIYAFVPRKTVQATLQEQALRKASQILSRADTHMSLEDQKVEEPLKNRVNRLAQKLIDEGDVW